MWSTFGAIVSNLPCQFSSHFCLKSLCRQCQSSESSSLSPFSGISSLFLAREQLLIVLFEDGLFVSNLVIRAWRRSQEEVGHPPYSPTEAPTGYHINRLLKNWQTAKVYNDLEEFVADVKAWIASKNQRYFARGIDQYNGQNYLS